MPEEEIKPTEAPPEKPDETKETKPATPTGRASEAINKANAAAERIEKANSELKELLDRQERINVENTLGGNTEAGSPATTEEEAADEAARKTLEGTGFGEQLFPKKQ